MRIVAIGSKALLSGSIRAGGLLVGDCVMGKENQSYNQGSKKKGMGRKAKKGSYGFDGVRNSKHVSGHEAEGSFNGKKSWKYHNASEPQTSMVR